MVTAEGDMDIELAGLTVTMADTLGPPVNPVTVAVMVTGVTTATLTAAL
jgi:hypothetical protein